METPDGYVDVDNFVRRWLPVSKDAVSSLETLIRNEPGLIQDVIRYAMVLAAREVWMRQFRSPLQHALGDDIPSDIFS